jgi:hypothetical protein
LVPRLFQEWFWDTCGGGPVPGGFLLPFHSFLSSTPSHPDLKLCLHHLPPPSRRHWTPSSTATSPATYPTTSPSPTASCPSRPPPPHGSAQILLDTCPHPTSMTVMFISLTVVGSASSLMLSYCLALSGHYCPAYAPSLHSLRRPVEVPNPPPQNALVASYHRLCHTQTRVAPRAAHRHA